MIAKPFRRIIRPFTLSGDNRYCNGVFSDSYLMDSDYSPDRISEIRAYETIERDLFRLFEYVEPADGNQSTYSHRIYELLLRASTEFEASCKGILKANRYSKSGNWNIHDYYKINRSSRLSDYELRIAIWHDGEKVLRPFADWATDSHLSWYQDYNAVKHNRSGQFRLANFHNLLLAVSGVFAVLFSQFYILSFRASDSIGMYQSDDVWLSHENRIFAIRPPQTWTADDCYGFDWTDLKHGTDRFGAYNF